MAADPVVETSAMTADPMMNEALRRWNRCAEWEAPSRQRFLDDLKFAYGDDVNGYQWPNRIRQAREIGSRPCLTMNLTRQHNLQIINDSKQNKTGMRVKATGNGSTKQSADVLEAVIRHVEYISEAQAAYAIASEFQVYAGIGWWRLTTDWADGESHDQEIFIRPISDPLSVYGDPDCKQRDGSDGGFAFVFDNVPRDEWEEAYPRFKGMASLQPMGISSADDGWLSEDHVRVCEYFRKVFKKDRVHSFVGPDGTRRNIRESLLPDSMVSAVANHHLTRSRDVWDEVIEWKLIVGEQIVDETIWPGKYIPLVRVIGEETCIEGVMDRKGHTRYMRDAQRMLNYNASSQVEFVALQSKTPWIAPAKAIEEMETYWNNGNNVNHAVLPWNHIDDEGNPVPPPFRQEPPNASPAYQTGMETAFNQMMMVSGQWQNQMGMMGNERTGEAISRRQGQGDLAVYHFFDNYEAAIRYTARQMIDLIPKVYDTKRILMLQAEDGSDMEVEVDPAARQAFLQQQDETGQVVRRVFNPKVGKYDVQASAGPAYGTRREETVKAMTLLLTQAPALTGIIGDLLLRSMDFREADEAAARLKRMVPAQALGTGPSQQEQQMQESIASLQTALGKALELNAKDKLKLVGKGELRDIDVYKAETERFRALADALQLDQGGIRAVVEQLVKDSLGTNLGPVLTANEGEVGEEGGASPGGSPAPPAPPEPPPVPGARRAPDGEWYLEHPTAPGSFLRVKRNG